ATSGAPVAPCVIIGSVKRLARHEGSTDIADPDNPGRPSAPADTGARPAPPIAAADLSMRVLELCLSGGHGGLELYVGRLCVQLRARGHDCTAVVAAGSMLAGRLAADGIPAIPLAVRARSLPLLAARRLARLID